ELTAQYTRKGSKIGLTGRIQTRSYENNEGKRVYVTEVIADQVAFLDSKSKSVETEGEPVDDNLPF
ncbi:MAG TPA: single-stranded DNA-binding protein, partial [Atopostipes sp.]|nr:single-stranded DNA-binding protein [Atopostipes sp.]